MTELQRLADNARVPDTRPSMSPRSRNAMIVGAVVVLHAAVLWSLQAGLLRRGVEVIVPVELIDAVSVPPTVAPPAAAPVAAPLPRPEPRPRVRTAPLPPPRPEAATETSPAAAPDAVTATTQPQPAAPPITLPVAAAPAAAPSPAPAKVELPVSDADYLHNPPPAYPRASERLGEKGLVVVHVLIGTDGRARKAQIARSSGFPRLDDASLAAVLGWRYVPGKRGGAPEEMWFDVPIRWGS